MDKDLVVEDAGDNIEDAYRTAGWLDWLARWILNLQVLAAVIWALIVINAGVPEMLVFVIGSFLPVLVLCALLHAAAVALRLSADRTMLG